MLSRGYRAAVGRVHPHPTCCIHPSTVRETTWNLAEKHRRTSAETTTRNAVAIVARERGELMKPLRGNARPGFRDSATSAAMKPQCLKLELRRACERPHRGSRFMPLRVIPPVWYAGVVAACPSRGSTCRFRGSIWFAIAVRVRGLALSSVSFAVVASWLFASAVRVVVVEWFAIVRLCGLVLSRFFVIAAVRSAVVRPVGQVITCYKDITLLPFGF